MTPVTELLVGLGLLVAGGIGTLAVDTWRTSRKALRLLQGEDEVDGDGVLARLRAVEDRIADLFSRVDRTERQLEAAGYTDGGRDDE